MKPTILSISILSLALAACGPVRENEATSPVRNTISPTPEGKGDIEDDASQPSTPGFVYETRSDGAVRLTVPPPGASDQNPAFSPDDSALLFTRFDSGYNEGPAGLYLLDLTTGSTTELFWEDDQDAVNLPGTSWSAVTNRIAFSSDREDVDEVWTMFAGGSGLFRVTNHTSASYFIEPSFSLDGQWIVFEAQPEDEQPGSIWKIRTDGSELTQLTDGPAGGTDDRQPNWSPTGERILFQRRVVGSDDWNIYTMTLEGGEIHQATTSPGSDTDASWSPDGRWIVFSSDNGDLPAPNIFAIRADGSELVRVTHDSTRYDGAVSWSADGKWIAFESHEGDEDRPSQLWLISTPEQLASMLK